MRALDAVKRVVAGLAELKARRRSSEFMCGECERWERCGLPPDENCIVKVAQLARDGRRPVKRPILTV